MLNTIYIGDITMADDGRSGAVENVKDKHYVGIDKGWEQRNNADMNRGMQFNNMKDGANTAHPPTTMKGETRNAQLSPTAADNNYDYNANR